MIWAIIYFIAGGLISLLIFTKKPKLEIPESKEFEQIEREIKEWLASPILPIKKELQLTTASDTGLEPYALEKPATAIPVVAFERADELHIKEQVV